jgi:hypothetical protein
MPSGEEEEEEKEGRLRAYNGAAAVGDALPPNKASKMMKSIQNKNNTIKSCAAATEPSSERYEKESSFI